MFFTRALPEAIKPRGGAGGGVVLEGVVILGCAGLKTTAPGRADGSSFLWVPVFSGACDPRCVGGADGLREAGWNPELFLWREKSQGSGTEGLVVSGRDG